MGDSVEHVGGLTLPTTLLRALGEGRWKPPADVVIREVFADEPDGPQFYDLPSLLAQNRFFQSKSDADLTGYGLGDDRGIGVTPSLAVLIGDLGADMSIALDYRATADDPRVIYFGLDGWREVAANFGDLERRLGL